MAEQHLLVDERQQPHDLERALIRDLDVEGAGKMQSLEIFHPGDGHLVIGPGAGHRNGDLIVAGPLERPGIVMCDLLDHVDRMAVASEFDLEKFHADAFCRFGTPEKRSGGARDLSGQPFSCAAKAAARSGQALIHSRNHATNSVY